MTAAVVAIAAAAALLGRPGTVANALPPGGASSPTFVPTLDAVRTVAALSATRRPRAGPSPVGGTASARDAPLIDLPPA
jgi:hypothetical protein